MWGQCSITFCHRQMHRLEMGKREPAKPTSFSKVTPLMSSTILDPHFPALNFIWCTIPTLSRLGLACINTKVMSHVTQVSRGLLSLFQCMASNLSVPLLNSVSNGKSNSSLVSVYGNECDRAGQRNYNTVYPQRSAQMLTALQLSC